MISNFLSETNSKLTLNSNKIILLLFKALILNLLIKNLIYQKLFRIFLIRVIHRNDVRVFWTEWHKINNFIIFLKLKKFKYFYNSN